MFLVLVLVLVLVFGLFTKGLKDYRQNI